MLKRLGELVIEDRRDEWPFRSTSAVREEKLEIATVCDAPRGNNGVVNGGDEMSLGGVSKLNETFDMLL